MTALTLDITDGIATLTMNRPQARNALNFDMKDAFERQVPALARDPAVRAVVLTGAGGTFCAGGDLRAMEEVRATMTPDAWRARMHEVHPWVRQLIEMDKPVIAAVDGAAFGAGFSLALTADFVLATARARFCLSFMKVGLVPDFGAAYTLPRVVGVQRAKELMLSAREVQADEALRLGLVMEVVPDAQALHARALNLARSLSQTSPLATSLVKRAIGRSLSADLQTQLDTEADHQALCYETAYHREAVRRFLGKEAPVYQWPSPDVSPQT